MLLLTTKFLQQLVIYLHL
ncbi:hypothetical protein CKAN_02092700 [Cinnamomum micranthum f. kanehirae]|uniref:Uncharacterized protein n=1 Tax=Cinnamomum micranthum f. kanehirae TaxID=337451 RepID=A0A443PLV2_9MAGN|nr:hypothetical protein CKAN_02092700 [Cinnamomum micranthum f. kanehirae]